MLCSEARGSVMKIRVAILDKDENYKSRLLYNFQIMYADKIELYSFSNFEQLINALENIHVDIILIDEYTEHAKEDIENSKAVVYLCRTAGIEAMNDCPAICKFQKLETIYRQLLSVYADIEISANVKVRKNSSKIVLFMSAQGGSGTSVAAAAYALKRAKEGKKVFYLNIEAFGGANLYFAGTGNMSFTDAIVALKSKKTNLVLKLESIIKSDQSGVDFIDISKNTYDMHELQDEEIARLLLGLSQVRAYEEIIVDVSGGFNERVYILMKEHSEKFVCVNDVSKTGNLKFERFCELLKVLEDRDKRVSSFSKMTLLYNRYSSKTSEQLEKTPVPVLGGIHRYEGVSGRDLIEQVANVQILEKI